MARFRVTAAIYVDAQGIGRVRAGRTVADSYFGSATGDVIWTGLNSGSLPAGFVPLDPAGEVMRAASRWAGTPIPATCLGCDSVDG